MSPHFPNLLYILLHRHSIEIVILFWYRQTKKLFFFLQVFNMNAPVPPATDGQVDSLKQPSQFPGGYGQGFSSQSESTVDQPDIPQETLQSGEGRALAHTLNKL